MGFWLKVAALGLLGVAAGLFARRPFQDAPEPATVTATARQPRTQHRSHGREIEQVLNSRGEQQVSEVLAFMERVKSGADCLSFAKNLIADPENRHSKTLWSLVLARWSVIDPDGLLEFVEEEKESGREHQLESMAWFALAASDPQRLAEMVPKLSSSIGLEALRGLAAVDPDLALEVAFRMPEVNDSVRAALSASDKHDPEQVRALMSRAVYDGMRGPMKRKIIAHLLQEDPRQALAFAQSQGRIWSDPVARTLGEAARDDPETAVKLLGELPSSRSRAISTVAVAKNWAMNDPAAALEWTRSQPAGEIRNTALVAVASVIGGADPRNGLALLEEIGWKNVGAFYSIGRVDKDSSLYNQVQEHDAVRTFDVARDLLRSLAVIDPGEARAYLNNSVPEVQRRVLTEALFD